MKEREKGVSKEEEKGMCVRVCVFVWGSIDFVGWVVGFSGFGIVWYSWVYGCVGVWVGVWVGV